MCSSDLLLEALTGERAYRGAARDVVRSRLVQSPLLPVSLGCGWTRLLGAMTRLDPDARPSAREVGARLAELAAADAAPDIDAAHATASSTEDPALDVTRPLDLPPRSSAA